MITKVWNIAGLYLNELAQVMLLNCTIRKGNINASIMHTVNAKTHRDW